MNLKTKSKKSKELKFNGWKAKIQPRKKLRKSKSIRKLGKLVLLLKQLMLILSSMFFNLVNLRQLRLWKGIQMKKIRHKRRLKKSSS
jgi:hypothetical protein